MQPQKLAPTTKMGCGLQKFNTFSETKHAFLERGMGQSTREQGAGRSRSSCKLNLFKAEHAFIITICMHALVLTQGQVKILETKTPCMYETIKDSNSIVGRSTRPARYSCSTEESLRERDFLFPAEPRHYPDTGRAAGVARAKRSILVPGRVMKGRELAAMHAKTTSIPYFFAFKVTNHTFFLHSTERAFKRETTCS